MQRPVARELDRDLPSIAEADGGDGMFPSLDETEQPRVQAELMHHPGPDAASQLRVEDLVGAVGDAAQEVDAALPATVEQRCLEDERGAGTHRPLGIARRGFELVAQPRAELAREVHMAAARLAQQRELLRFVGAPAPAQEVRVRIVGRTRPSAFAPHLR